MNIMRARLERYDVKRWAHDFMDRLNHIKDIEVNFNSFDERLKLNEQQSGRSLSLQVEKFKKELKN